MPDITDNERDDIREAETEAPASMPVADVTDGDEASAAHGEPEGLESLIGEIIDGLPDNDGTEVPPDASAERPVETDLPEDDWGDDGDDIVAMGQVAEVITDAQAYQGPMATTPWGSRAARLSWSDGSAPTRSRVGAMLASAAAGLAIGVVGTLMILGATKAPDIGSPETAALPSSGTVGEDGLDSAMVSYDIDGGTVSLSVRDVIERTGSLESAKDDKSGEYCIPSAEKALEAVRDDIVEHEAEAHGISVTDGDILEYASDTYGVSTIDELARQVGLDEEETERQLRDRVVISKLKGDVTGNRKLLPLVEPPSPDDGIPTTMTEGYAAYIINLAGDEWDAGAAKWSSESGAFAKALDGMAFDGQTASYDMARKAYDVVRQRNDAIRESIDGSWSEYLNGLLRKTTVRIETAAR